MARRRAKGKPKKAQDAFRDEMLSRMAHYGTVEDLNHAVIAPFVAALETVCGERGYMLNIYGERSNLAFSTEEDAEAIYKLIERYLDTREDG